MKIFGIPVKVQPFFLLVVGFLGYSRNLPFEFIVEWVIVVFISILAHEFGHALTVRAFGMSPQILIYGFGGMTSWTDEKDVSPPKHIAISLAGPFAGFLFGGVVYLSNIALPDLFADHLGRVTYRDLLWVNWGWGIFNLLPVLPLDGGNVAYTIEQWVTKKHRGVITRVISLLVAGGVGLWALSIEQLWVVFLMALFAMNNGRALLQLFQTNQDESVRPLLDQARDAVKNDDGATAVQLAKEAKKSAHSQEVEEEAQRILLIGLILVGEIEQAKKEADRLQAVYGHTALLRALAGFERDQLPRAVPVIEYSYPTSPSPELNYTFADVLIAAGRLREASELIARQQNPGYAAASYVALQTAAFNSGEFDLSSEAGRQALERKKDPAIAYNIACAEARAGRADEALAWIERAVEIGYRDVEAMVSDSDLETLRSRPEFEAICGKLREVAV
jgi:Zn-dependent protease